MKLVFVTQQVDPEHPALGATVAKIAALAARADEVVALADTAIPGALPPNCRTRTFGARTRVGRGLRFAAALARELPGLRGGAVVAHMCPIYAILAAPLVRPLGIPLALWFTHWRPSAKLRLAERCSTVVATVDRRSFPLDSPKLRPIGHGIDLGGFACSERPEPGETLRLAALGRYSPSKGYPTMLRAVKLAGERGVDVRLTVHGPTLTDEERRTRPELERLHAELGLGDRVVLGGPIPRAEVPALLAGSDALVNDTYTGGFDKIVYEAAASCTPVIASNPGFGDLLEPELHFPHGDADRLADRFAAFARTARAERAAIGARQRERVVAEHSVDAWAERLLALL